MLPAGRGWRHQPEDFPPSQEQGSPVEGWGYSVAKCQGTKNTDEPCTACVQARVLCGATAGGSSGAEKKGGGSGGRQVVAELEDPETGDRGEIAVVGEVHRAGRREGGRDLERVGRPDPSAGAELRCGAEEWPVQLDQEDATAPVRRAS